MVFVPVLQPTNGGLSNYQFKPFNRDQITPPAHHQQEAPSPRQPCPAQGFFPAAVVCLWGQRQI